ncbi:MAG: hypothetical protein KDA31_00105 [Phycisphaerales bacterium]|nr:hypothetical protein [Phycisphaerales bacterium]MCB9837327.1 hypothetical protein [Phycisphaera sp.]
MRQLTAITLLLACLTGCGEPYEKPTQVRVSRVITAAGDRVVTYTAMYDDGIETYIDFDPQGDVDMITVERDSVGDLTHYVRKGFETRATENDAAEHTELTPEWQKRFEYIDSLGDVDLVPWDDGHGMMTPRDFDQMRQGQPESGGR